MNLFIPPVTHLGQTVGRNPGRFFGIKRSDRLFHTYVIGQTGTGKTTLLGNMIRQDIDHSEGFCLIDPHGDLADEIAPLIEGKGVFWDLADPDCPHGYNPLSYVQEQYRPLVASALIDAFKKQWNDAWGVRMEHLLRFALLALLDRPGSSLSDIIPLFTDKTFRGQVLEHVIDPQVRTFWQNEYPKMNYKNAFDGVAPIANKLGGFLSHPLVRKALCRPDEPLRFRKIIDDGTPLVVSLPKGQLGNDITNIVGGLVVTMISQAAYSRTNIPEHRRRPYFLYADEFHSFTTESFAQSLAELRKYRLGLVLAHQHTSQLGRETLDAIFGNVGTIIAFRLGATDGPLVAKQLGEITPADLVNLPNYRMFTKLMVDGKQTKAFSAQTME